MFTLNNYDDDSMDLMVGFDYCIVGKEIGDKGTPHLQGYVCMTKRKRLTAMKRILPTAHLEIMRGTPYQAAEYCRKDGDYEEFGTPPDNGGASGGLAKAARYRSAIQLSKEGLFDRMEEDHPDMYWNSYHTMKRIRMDNPTTLECLSVFDNQWIMGVSGVGKSSTARRENPGAYVKSHNKWWLGYKNEPVVIYDDLGKPDAPWIGEFLKQWADHYPFPAETKGDGMMLRPEKIIVTSQYSIETLFGHDEQLSEALNRRFRVRHLIVPIVYNQPIVTYESDLDISWEEDEDL